MHRRWQLEPRPLGSELSAFDAVAVCFAHCLRVLSPSVVPASAASCPPPSVRLRPLVPLCPGFRGLWSLSSPYCCNYCSGVVSSSSNPHHCILIAPLADGTLTVHCCTTQHHRLFVRSLALAHLFCVSCLLPPDVVALLRLPLMYPLFPSPAPFPRFCPAVPFRLTFRELRKLVLRSTVGLTFIITDSV